MKKSLLTLALAAFSLATAAQTAPATARPAATAAAPAGYAELMAQAVADITSTGDAAQLQALASKMERAAAMAPADWLPRYYQAYALVIQVFQSKESGDVKDKTLDQAEAALAQARKLGGDESELLTLQAYAYQARLGVAPGMRAQQYSAMVNEAVDQAQALNPANPRAYLVAANNLYFTPKMYGGGPEAAKPLYETAKARYAAFRPAGPLAPNWGQHQLLERLQRYEAPAVAGK